MIQTIIKRDGRDEDFAAAKVNGWGEWAAKTLGKYVDWPLAVTETVAKMPSRVSSRDFQLALIKTCLDKDSWSYNRMAGRLYAPLLYKEILKAEPDNLPSIYDVHQKMIAVGVLRPMDYTIEEYEKINKMLRHDRDLKCAHFQLQQVREKYSLRNRLTGEEYETRQYALMRMAMFYAELEPKNERLHHVRKFYEKFSREKINAPTPNYVNAGTYLNGYASCCLFQAGDNAASIAAATHIAETMTYMSAGLGDIMNVRSLLDPVRGGLIKHQGKLPYYRARSAVTRSNMQNGRSGANTSYWQAYDPEFRSLLLLKNPRTPADKRIRGIDYCMILNRFLGVKAAREEDVFLFNIYKAPDLYHSMFKGDQSEFERLYAKYEADESFHKVYVPAREILIGAQNQGYETGRYYLAFIHEINRHTPHRESIYSSNLCTEITQPTWFYESTLDLYSPVDVGYIEFSLQETGERCRLVASEPVEVDGDVISAYELQAGQSFRRLDMADASKKFRSELNRKLAELFPMDRYGSDHLIAETEKALLQKWEDEQVMTGTVHKVEGLKREPEVSLCSLAGIVVTNIEDDEDYAETAYYALKMIDVCIDRSDYVLPHIGFTAKQRRNAGVGMMDLAHYMAARGIKYSTDEGMAEVHRVAERHAYFVIRASLRLGKEKGNAPWMHKTKWPKGWLPIDTYNRSIDEVTPPVYQYDWETLRAEIIANGGIRHSSLVSYMPGESSSKASGTCNSIYPIRYLSIIKTDNEITTYWAAPNGEKYAKQYELCWDIPTRRMIDFYGVVQKFTDQSISADLYRVIRGGDKITSEEMLGDIFHMLKRGIKTRYYINEDTADASAVNNAFKLNQLEPVDDAPAPSEEDEEGVNQLSDGPGCSSGVCTL